MSDGAAHTGAVGPRAGWPDVAKGVCISLVVLWHVVTKHAIGVDGAGPITDAWATLNAQLLPLRMPLFFVISGMFARGVIGAGSGHRWRRRALRHAALYVVWVLIQTAVLALAPDFDTARARSGWELLAQLTISPTNLWYLAALALYLVVARLVRHVPTAVVLPAALLLSSVAASGLLPDLGNLWQVAQNLVFFLAGLRFRGAIERFAASMTVVSLLMLAAAYVTLSVTVGLLSLRSILGVWPALAVVAVAVGVSACVMLDRRFGSIAHLLRWIGRRTLPIYVIHMIPLALIDGALRGVHRTAGPIGEILSPVILTAVVIGICLVVHAGLVRIGLGALFDSLLVSDRLRRRAENRAARADRQP